MFDGTTVNALRAADKLLDTKLEEQHAELSDEARRVALNGAQRAYVAGKGSASEQMEKFRQWRLRRVAENELAKNAPKRDINTPYGDGHIVTPSQDAYIESPHFIANTPSAKIGSAVNFNRMRALTKGRKPLFHMVNDANIPEFVENAAEGIATPAELAAKGKSLSVEQGMRGHRAVMEAAGDFSPEALVDRLNKRVMDADLPARELGSVLSSTEKDVKATQMLGGSSLGLGLGGSPYQIHVTEGRPLAQYGHVGVMGGVPKNHNAYELRHDYLGGGRELAIAPDVAVGVEGFSDVRLPKFNGAPVYDPQKVDRDTALRLKEQGGIPINRRFRAMLRRLNKQPEVDARLNVLGWDPSERRAKTREVAQKRPDLVEQGRQNRVEFKQTLRDEGIDPAHHVHGGRRRWNLKEASNLAQDFIGGVDPFGMVTGQYGANAERAGVSEKEHAAKLTASTAGGLIGGATVVPSAIYGLLEGGKGLAAGKGVKGRLAEGGAGFVRGFKHPLQSVAKGFKAKSTLSDVAERGGRHLSKSEFDNLSDLGRMAPIGAVQDAVNKAGGPGNMGASLVDALRIGTLSSTAAKHLQPAVNSQLRDGIAQLGLGGAIGGTGAAIQYQKGRQGERETQRRLDRATLGGNALYRKGREAFKGAAFLGFGRNKEEPTRGQRIIDNAKLMAPELALVGGISLADGFAEGMDHTPFIAGRRAITNHAIDQGGLATLTRHPLPRKALGAAGLGLGLASSLPEDPSTRRNLAIASTGIGLANAATTAADAKDYLQALDYFPDKGVDNANRLARNAKGLATAGKVVGAGLGVALPAYVAYKEHQRAKNAGAKRHFSSLLDRVDDLTNTDGIPKERFALSWPIRHSVPRVGPQIADGIDRGVTGLSRGLIRPLAQMTSKAVGAVPGGSKKLQAAADGVAGVLTGVPHAPRLNVLQRGAQNVSDAIVDLTTNDPEFAVAAAAGKATPLPLMPMHQVGRYMLTGYKEPAATSATTKYLINPVENAAANLFGKGRMPMGDAELDEWIAKQGSAREVVDTYTRHGLKINVEFKKGTYREGSGKNGKTWKRLMHCDYGEIPKTLGVDGDAVDVYVGPHEDSDVVYIVHQMKFPTFKKYDEDKVLLGFKSAKDAKAAYLKHYPDNRVFGSMSAVSVDDFKRALKHKGIRGKRISAALVLDKTAKLFGPDRGESRNDETSKGFGAGIGLTVGANMANSSLIGALDKDLLSQKASPEDVRKVISDTERRVPNVAIAVRDHTHVGPDLASSRQPSRLGYMASPVVGQGKPTDTLTGMQKQSVNLK